MAEEERQDLTDFRLRASLQLRHALAVDLLRHEAEHWARGITPVDRSPEGFVEEHED